MPKTGSWSRTFREHDMDLKHNSHGIITDWRYLKYPQKTYGGCGTHTDLNNSFRSGLLPPAVVQARYSKKIGPGHFYGLDSATAGLSLEHQRIETPTFFAALGCATLWIAG